MRISDWSSDVCSSDLLNGGAGLKTDLSGNELPNSPHWTVNVGAEYTIPFGTEWSATIRGDAYWQAKSWARVYNLNPYDRLRDWTNFNISLRVDRSEEHTSELQSLMRNSYAVFCLKKKKIYYDRLI